MLQKNLLDVVEVGTTHKDRITTLFQVPMLTPRYIIINISSLNICGLSNGDYRGHYDIEFYPTFMKLHGKTHDYKLNYESYVSGFISFPCVIFISLLLECLVCSNCLNQTNNKFSSLYVITLH